MLIQFLKKKLQPFKVPDGIVMMVVDQITGQKVDFNSKSFIYESFKEKNLSEISNEKNYNNLLFNKFEDKNKLIKKFY